MQLGTEQVGQVTTGQFGSGQVVQVGQAGGGQFGSGQIGQVVQVGHVGQGGVAGQSSKQPATRQSPHNNNKIGIIRFVIILILLAVIYVFLPVAVFSGGN